MFDGGEGYGTYEYEADDQGQLFVRLRSRFGDEPFPLQYVLGSGQHALTMLTLAPGVDGQTEGIEHRVSCYPGSRIGLTPGHSKMQPEQALEFFGDASRGEPLERCVYCHTTTSKIEKEQVTQLVASVNCEKCHGPGSEHVRQARNSRKPPPFSVGHPNWDAESEIQLCGDCHRMPRGMTDKELREYSDILTRFQPIGMLRSLCYLESDRQLRCTSCHNPHATIGQSSEADHVRNCVRCHQEGHDEHVVCPESPRTGCIECHMPAVELDQGLQFHDHWIRVRDD
ncbi:MAG: multiheme c-type cytochrome [Rubripirellula sp.]